MSSKDDREAPPPDPTPLTGTVFDAHCHFDAMAHRAGVVGRHDAAPAAFVAAAMAKAAAVGVPGAITVGCEVGEWDSTIAATDQPGVYGALGLHPTEVNDVTEADYERLVELLAHPKVVAIGETGLDYYWDRTDPTTQQQHFRRHIQLAHQLDMPLVIHDREAHADVLRIVAEEGAPSAGVIFHSFSGDAAMAERCLAAGYFLSFSGVLTFKNAPELRAAAELAPLDRVLVETDAPFLTPHPFRGRPNAPYLIPHVVRQLAELYQTDESVVCATISATGRQIFGIDVGNA